MKKLPLWLKVLAGLLALFLLIQLVPYGRSHSNPVVQSEPAWDSPTTRLLAQRACFDCHSNEVVYPWYSNVAPVSWLVQNDVDEGRVRMNFSEWAQGGSQSFGEISELVNGGEMPPAKYLLMHPNAKLTDAEKAQFLQGLQTTLAGK